MFDSDAFFAIAKESSSLSSERELTGFSNQKKKK